MGRVYKRKNAWYLDYTTNGKRYRERGSKDRKTAERLLAEKELKIDRGEEFLKDKPAEEYIAEHLKNCQITKSPFTYDRYESILLKLFLPFLRSAKITYLHQVTPSLIEKYKISRLETVKDTTINKELKIIKTFFNRAVEDSYAKKNPTQNIKFMKVQQRFPRYLSKEEIRKLSGTATGNMKDIIITFLNTGMRRKELTILRWEDIDLKNKRMTIQEQTKNRRPRIIPINDSLLEVLQRRLKTQNGPYVFPTRTGKPKEGHSLLRDIKLVYKKAGITGAGIHTLRHTFASHLIMAGVDLASVKELLGHSQITTTMIYSHLAPEHLKGATERLKF